MSLLDPLQPGFQKIYLNGVEQSPARGGLNYTGSFTVTDDPGNNRKSIAAPGSGGGGGLTFATVTAGGTSSSNTVEAIGTRAVTITRNLPATPTLGDRVMYVDSGALADVWTITVDAGIATIVNGTTTSTFIMNSKGEVSEFMFVATGVWMRIR
jgi:hypothetical protein